MAKYKNKKSCFMIRFITNSKISQIFSSEWAITINSFYWTPDFSMNPWVGSGLAASSSWYCPWDFAVRRNWVSSTNIMHSGIEKRKNNCLKIHVLLAIPQCIKIPVLLIFYYRFLINLIDTGESCSSKKKMVGFFRFSSLFYTYLLQ